MQSCIEVETLTDTHTGILPSSHLEQSVPRWFSDTQALTYLDTHTHSPTWFIRAPVPPAYSCTRSSVHVYCCHTANTQSYYSSTLMSDKVISSSLRPPMKGKINNAWMPLGVWSAQSTWNFSLIPFAACFLCAIMSQSWIVCLFKYACSMQNGEKSFFSVLIQSLWQQIIIQRGSFAFISHNHRAQSQTHMGQRKRKQCRWAAWCCGCISLHILHASFLWWQQIRNYTT